MTAQPLRLLPGAEAVVADSGTVVLRNGARSVEARGLDPELLRAIVGAIDGVRSRDDVVDELALRHPRTHVEAVVRGLTGTVLRPEDETAGDAPTGTVGVIGGGPLASAVAAALGPGGRLEVRRWPARRFASCDEPAFRAARRARMPLLPDGHAPEGDGAPEGDDPLTVALLEELLGGVDLAVCALESVPYRAHLDVADAARRSGTPVLFVSGSPDGGTVGPVYVPSASACFECERLSAVFDGATGLGRPGELLPFLHALAVDGGSDLAQRLGEEAADVVRSVWPTPQVHGAFTHVTRMPRGGAATRSVVLPRADCSRCGVAGPLGPEPTGPLVLAARADVALEEDRASARRPARSAPRGGPAYRTVGILGGGTAGYLTALTFRRRFPDIDVTLIESSRVGVIGVGEATTPRLTEYLHSPADLGLDIVDFHERVLPVWKLGVLYQWGRPGNEFPWPFQYGALLDAYAHDGNLSAHCLASMLMDAKRVPVLRDADGVHTSLLGRVPFAYHLDNPRFVRYLQEEADRAGVRRRDLVVADAEVSADGQEVEALLTEDGERLSFDLYVDCSGFRSVLLEGKLGSPFVSYADSLFTDSAVVANVPHDGVTKPYTVAETMANGWCWNIAFEDADHRGYVFSSAFCSADEAEAEMRATNPGMGDAWSLRFRSGRHEHFWRGNVVAVGNAYAFVEPLASTAIHMLLFELDLLAGHLPGPTEQAHKDQLNAQANAMWDSLRGWLAVQYRFNTRMDTPFWRACASDVELAGAAPHVQRFRERGLLSGDVGTSPPGAAGLSRYANDYFSQDYVYDVMLLGQDVAGRLGRPATGLAEWQARTGRNRSLVGHALPQNDALEWARKHPEELRDLVTSPDSWLGEQLY